MLSEMQRRFVQNNDVIHACIACDPANPESDHFLRLADMEPMTAQFPNIIIYPTNLEHQVAVAHQIFLKDAPGSMEEWNGCLN